MNVTNEQRAHELAMFILNIRKDKGSKSSLSGGTNPLLENSISIGENYIETYEEMLKLVSEHFS